jgi:hypothetical protein
MAESSGVKTVTRLRKYINGKPTRDTKPNTAGDPDYIAPYTDNVSCPIVPPPVVPPPSVVPVAPPPVFVVEEETVPETSSCSECSTTVVEDKICSEFEIMNTSNFSELSYQIRDCRDGSWVARDLQPNEEAIESSIGEPRYNSGPGQAYFNFLKTGVKSGFKDVDINKYHYITTNCFNNKEKRYVRHTSQLNPGNVVKTEHSSCCWHVDNQVPPRKAFDIVLNETTSIYNNCNDCCTGTATIPNKNAVLSGNTTTSANCSNSIIQSSVFTVTSPGNVRMEFSINTTTGEYTRGTGRVLKVGDGLSEKVASFPLNPYGYPPYVQNGKETVDSTDVTKIVNLKVGTYRIEIDPLQCASGAFGTATLTATPQID